MKKQHPRLDGAPPRELEDMLRVARAEEPDARLLDRTLASLAVAGTAGAVGLAAGAKSAAAATAVTAGGTGSGGTAATAAGAGAATASVVTGGTGTAALGAVGAKAGALTLLAVTKWGAVGFVAGSLVAGGTALIGGEAPYPETVSPPPSAPGATSTRPPVRKRPLSPPEMKLDARESPGAHPSVPLPHESMDEPIPIASASARRVGALATSSARPEMTPMTGNRGSSFLRTDNDGVHPTPSAPGAAAACEARECAGSSYPPQPRADDPFFRRELALVDGARAALGRGDTRGALRHLAAHDREFGTSGHFSPEVLYLRVEAHSKGGDRPGAREAAREVLRRYPNGPHAARARSELEDNKP